MGGSSVWYHARRGALPATRAEPVDVPRRDGAISSRAQVIRGAKVFWLAPPTVLAEVVVEERRVAHHAVHQFGGVAAATRR